MPSHFKALYVFMAESYLVSPVLCHQGLFGFVMTWVYAIGSLPSGGKSCIFQKY